MRRRTLIVVVLVLALLLILGTFVARFRLSALEEPSTIETRLATAAKRWFVSRGARGVSLPVVLNEAQSVERGAATYGVSCSFCHGIGGRRPIDVGLWMYPRSPELGASAVGQWTDAELFWIIKNGIRLTGMPGFAQIHSDEEIADLVRYVRSQADQASEE